ncbi:MAG: winged helix-turn-helix transcriptional regulator [Blastochloris sp.]|nr:winged helix-turn-helix transcriptional regulator [Blastochloris sp.]
MLEAVERNPKVSQRTVASELGIALGLANAYLRRCVRKGLIKIGEVPRRRYAYYLTPQGFTEKSRLTASFLSHSFTFFRRARTQCGDCFATARAREQTRFLLVGSGDISDVARLIAGEHAVTIVGIIAAAPKPAILRKAAAEAGEFDAVLVVTLESAIETYAACVETFGAGATYAPPMLGIGAPRSPEPGLAAIE